MNGNGGMDGNNGMSGNGGAGDNGGFMGEDGDDMTLPTNIGDRDNGVING